MPSLTISGHIMTVVRTGDGLPDKWQMLFNVGKCKCLHTGPGNTGMNYEMGGNIPSKTVKEKDLGVTINANMKVSEQIRIATRILE